MNIAILSLVHHAPTALLSTVLRTRAHITHFPVNEMSVLLETSLGDIVIDLEVEACPKTCENFLKLCKVYYYNLHAFFNGISSIVFLSSQY